MPKAPRTGVGMTDRIDHHRRRLLLALAAVPALALPGMGRTGAALAAPPVAADGAALRTVLQIGHNDRDQVPGPIRAIRISPDNRLVATGSSDEHVVKLWDAETGRLLRTMRGHDTAILSVAFSGDSRHLVSGDRGKTMVLWDVESGAAMRRFATAEQDIVSIAVTPDGRHVLAGSKAQIGHSVAVELFDTTSATLVRRLEGHDGATLAVAVSPDGKIAASAGERMLTLWDLASGKVLRDLPAYAAEGVSAVFSDIVFSPDGQSLFTSRTMTLWDVASGDIRRRFSTPADRAGTAAFSSDGQYLLTADEYSKLVLQMWDVATGERIRRFAQFNPGAYRENWDAEAVAFLPNRRGVLAVGRFGSFTQWHRDTGVVVDSVTPPRGGDVRSIAVTPDGGALVSAQPHGALVWDLTSGTIRRRLGDDSSHDVNATAIFPDGRLVLTGEGAPPRDYRAPGGADVLILREIDTGRTVRSFKGHRGPVISVAVSADGRRIVSGSEDRTMKLWDATSGALLRSFDDHTNAVYAVVTSGDGQRLVSAGDKATVVIWDAASGKTVRTIAADELGVSTLALSSDGKGLLTGGWSKTAILWDAVSGTKRHTLTGHAAIVIAVAFSADGRVAATGDNGGSVYLWDTTTGLRLLALDGHEDGVTSITFLPNGRFLATGGRDKTVRLWNIQSGQLAATLFGDEYDSIALAPDGRFVAHGDPRRIVALVRGTAVQPIDDVLQRNRRQSLAELLTPA
ncbi:WD40 repeat domain-containing protein [Reyranella sp. CPCC 100927]|nr:WD40 repeat domain-containing protein [Reyranella sp. CPCC 100927]